MNDMDTRIINSAYFGSSSVIKMYEGSELVWPLYDYGFTLEPVDFGLPVKWATCNLGASTPSDYGNYYAWAEKETKATYTQDNYKWYEPTPGRPGEYTCTYHGTGFGMWKKDDIAHAASSKWRIPTPTEFEDLRFATTHEWITMNNVQGVKFTGLNDYSNNWIFIPAAGEFDYRNRYSETSGDAGYYAECWTSYSNYNEPTGSDKSAHYFRCGWYFNPFDQIWEHSYENTYDLLKSKYIGLPIRPVYTA